MARRAHVAVIPEPRRLVLEEETVGDPITHRYRWRAAADAFAMLAEDRSRALGVLLDWRAE